MHAGQRSIFYCAASMALASVIGCGHEIVIPGSAKIVDSGEGRVRYVAEENGTVYLLDSSAKKPVFNIHISSGDKITIDPDLDLIDIAGKPAEHKQPLNPEHVYRLYFDRDS